MFNGEISNMHEELLEISKLILDKLREECSASVFTVWLSTLKLNELTEEEPEVWKPLLIVKKTDTI